jgi:hypothetical protein
MVAMSVAEAQNMASYLSRAETRGSNVSSILSSGPENLLSAIETITYITAQIAADIRSN